MMSQVSDEGRSTAGGVKPKDEEEGMKGMRNVVGALPGAGT